MGICLFRDADAVGDGGVDIRCRSWSGGRREWRRGRGTTLVRFDFFDVG